MSASSGGTPHGAEGLASDDWDGLAGASEFVNRVRELEQLGDALHALARGAPTRQLIQGEGGIGKSRLLAEAISRDVQRNALGLSANSSEAGAAAIGRMLLRARDPGRIEERRRLHGPGARVRERSTLRHPHRPIDVLDDARDEVVAL